MASQPQFSQHSQQSQQPPLSEAPQSQPPSHRRKRIFVTGAGGQTGKHVIKYLEEKADQFDIYAGVYAERKDEAEQCIKSCCPNAKIVPINADNVDSLVKAFEGVDDLFIVPTATDYKVPHACNYIRAAKRANVKFVLLLSMTGAEERDSLFSDQFREIEETLEREEIKNYCVLRSNYYMQNLLLYKEPLKKGVLPLPIKEGRFNPVDVDDIGRAAQCILSDCHQHIGKWYNLTGPAALSVEEIASAFGQLLNTQITRQDIPRAEARAFLRRMNVPLLETQGLLDFYELVQRHELKEQEKNDYPSITGRQPTSLLEFLSRHKQQLAA